MAPLGSPGTFERGHSLKTVRRGFYIYLFVLQPLIGGLKFEKRSSEIVVKKRLRMADLDNAEEIHF